MLQRPEPPPQSHAPFAQECEIVCRNRPGPGESKQLRAVEYARDDGTEINAAMYSVFPASPPRMPAAGNDSMPTTYAARGGDRMQSRH